VEARWTSWSEEHVARHGVEWHEVEEALTPPIVSRPVSEGALKVLGRTYAGRYLAVIVSPDGDPPTVFVITARDMDDRERKQYQARQNKG
jgi:uncharacterized DUF497 family protein